MSHILDHDDLHQTLTQLASQREAPPPVAAPAKRPSTLTAAHFAGRVSAVTHAAARRASGHGGGAGGTRGPERLGSARSSRSRNMQAGTGKCFGAAVKSAPRASTAGAARLVEGDLCSATAVVEPHMGGSGSAAAAAAALGDICADAAEARGNGPAVTVSGLLAGMPREEICDLPDEDCDLDARMRERVTGTLPSNCCP